MGSLCGYVGRGKETARIWSAWLSGTCLSFSVYRVAKATAQGLSVVCVWMATMTLTLVPAWSASPVPVSRSPHLSEYLCSPS